jgi:hypothetical protein
MEPAGGRTVTPGKTWSGPEDGPAGGWCPRPGAALDYLGNFGVDAGHWPGGPHGAVGQGCADIAQAGLKLTGGRVSHHGTVHERL